MQVDESEESRKPDLQEEHLIDCLVISSYFWHSEIALTQEAKSWVGTKSWLHKSHLKSEDWFEVRYSEHSLISDLQANWSVVKTRFDEQDVQIAGSYRGKVPCSKYF